MTVTQYRCYTKELIDNILSHLWELARSDKDEHRHKDAVDCALYVIQQLENSVQVDTSAKSEQEIREKVLDELTEKVKTNWEFLFGILPYNDSVNKSTLLKWLEELRSKQGEQR